MRNTRMLTIGVMILLVAGMTAWAQTDPQVLKVIKTEVKVVDPSGVVKVVTAGDPQSQVSTFTFVASEMGWESKVVKGSPFSADTATEFTQILGNGQRLYRKNTGVLARDSEGRTRREQTIDAIGSYAAAGPAHQSISINDPVSGTSYALNPTYHTGTMFKMPAIAGGDGNVKMFWSQSAAPAVANVVVQSGTGDVVRAMGGGVAGGVTASRIEMITKSTDGVLATTTTKETLANTRTETLGKQMIGGIEAEGTRTIETIPAGTIGNDTPIEIVSEKWYSNDLGMVVKTRRIDPMSGENVYQLTNIKLGEPSPLLFQVPADYTVKEATVKIQTIRK